jgi:hypothetical protein
MTFSLNISAAALLGLLAAGCATQESVKLDAANQLRGPVWANSESAESAGLSSSAAGDNWTAANLFQKADAGADTPLNRFNLAAAYQSTGRVQQAATLYRSVMGDGGYLHATTSPLNDNRGGDISRINLAQESGRRLAAIETPAHPSSVGLARNATVGKPSASALVGGPTHGRVSDARALELDDAAAATR